MRRYAVAAVFFTLTEGLIGAALVLAGLVGDKASMTRAFIVSFHLVNTLLLLASLARSASSASTTEVMQLHSTDSSHRPSPRAIRLRIWHGIGLLGVVAIAVTGTIAALGDTLFPAASLVQGFYWDFSGSSNTLLRLRVIHPVIAALMGGFLVMHALRTLSSETSVAAKRLAKCLLVLILLQIGLGLLNLLLLTPLWAQILHLLTADLTWLTAVLLSAEMLVRSQHAAAGKELEGAKVRKLADRPGSEG